MYIAVDVGATKTLVALLDKSGRIVKHDKQPTNPLFSEFIEDLKTKISALMDSEVKGLAVGIPGSVDYETGVGLYFGNLDWENVSIAEPLRQAFGLPVLIENDANLAGLSEARALQPPAKTVVYVTISTGVGTGIIIDGKIDPHFAKSEGGVMHFEQAGQLVTWEDLAAGSTIKAKYGRLAADIPEDDPIWVDIARNIALGLSSITALIAPDVIIIGGGVGTHLKKFENELERAMIGLKEKTYELPKIVQAKHAEEAVVYGGYELLKDYFHEHKPA